MFKEYFGITPKNKKEGCFQDVHWSTGFGYFPTYVLGSAISAMVLNQMKKEFDPFKDMACGDFTKVNAWLKENIHKYGKSKTNKEIVLNACKEEFNPKYYIEYLKNKFKEIYNL